MQRILEQQKSFIMYTDTKNLANLSNNNTNAAAKLINTQNQDDKFQLKKVWKPILRLMSRKSSATKNSKRDSTTIPNNVNLNNANAATTTTIKDTLPLPQEESRLTHKLPLTEFWQTQHTSEASQTRTSQPLEFISKASIDKTPLDTCSNCIYGRNCQHTQFHQTTDTSLPVHHPHHLQQNFNYFDAEDGCFVWSDSNTDIDESALREWLWQNSWQFAENATMC